MRCPEFIEGGAGPATVRLEFIPDENFGHFFSTEKVTLTPTMIKLLKSSTYLA